MKAVQACFTSSFMELHESIIRLYSSLSSLLRVFEWLSWFLVPGLHTQKLAVKLQLYGLYFVETISKERLIHAVTGPGKSSCCSSLFERKKKKKLIKFSSFANKAGEVF